MKKLVVCAIVLAAAASVASAGEVLGKITAGGASVADAATVAAKCGGKDYPAVKTDKSGSYHLVLACEPLRLMSMSPRVVVCASVMEGCSHGMTVHRPSIAGSPSR